MDLDNPPPAGTPEGTTAPAPETPAPETPKADTGFLVPNNRSAVLDAIAARRNQVREEVDPADRGEIIEGSRDAAAQALRRAAGEIEEDSNDDDVVDEPTSDATDEQDAESDAEDDAPAAPAPAKAPAAAKAAPAPGKVIVNIDGQAVEVDEKVIANTIAKTANERLDRLETALSRTQPAALAGDEPAATTAAPQGNQGEAVEPLSDDELTRVQQAIQFGSDEDARKALADLVARASTSAQQSALQAMRSELDARERRVDIEKSVKRLQKKYPEVMGDNDLRMVAIENVFHTRSKQLAELGYDSNVLAQCLTTPAGRQEIIRTADAEVARGRLKQTRDDLFTDVVAKVHAKFVQPLKQSNGQSQQTEDRRERKRRLDPPPPTATGARAALAPDEEPRTASASEVVARMRKARGQLV